MTNLRAVLTRPAEHRPWAAFLSVAASLVIVYLKIAAARPVVYLTFSIAAGLAILFAAHRWALPHRRGWLKVAIGTLSWGVGDVVWHVYGSMGTVPFPSVADVIYLAGYPIIGWGIIQIVRTGTGSSRVRSPLTEAALITLSIGTVYAVAVIDPILHGSGALLSKAIQIGYLVGDLFVIALIAHLVLRPRRPDGMALLLLLSSAALLVGDTVYVTDASTGLTSPLVADVGYLVSYALLAGAALHPAARRAVPDDPSFDGSDRRLLIYVAIAFFPFPALWWVNQEVGHVDLAWILLGLGGMTVVLAFRLFSMVHSLRSSEAEARQEHERANEQTRELERGELRLRALLASSANAVLVLNDEARITFASAGSQEITGHDPSGLVGSTGMDIVHPDDRDHVARVLVGLLSGEDDLVDVDFRVRRIDGAVRWVSAQATSALQNEAVGGIVVNLHDITERRSAEEMLRVTERRRAAVIDAALDAVVTIDGEGRIIEWNRTAESVFGYNRVNVLGRRMSDLMIPPHLRAAHEMGFSRYHETGQKKVIGTRREVTAMRADGTEFPAELAVSAVDVGDEEVYIAFVRDLSEVKGLEEALLHAQRMEAAGRLAGGVAHDFNNLLAIILNYAAFALEDLPEGDPLRADIEEIRSAGERGAGLVRQLLAFSRKDVARPEVFDLNVVLHDVKSLLARTIGEDVRLELETSPSPAWAEMDPSHFDQIVMNLAVNARDAMPNGGFLRIEMYPVLVEGDHAEQTQAGRYTALVVRDSGAGIPAEIRDRIFEPFFTTKGVGSGTGLGLSTVYGIVSRAGGRIEVESAPGEGTCFTILLPLAEEPSVHMAPERSDDIHGGSGHVLLVEDEEQIRKLSTRILRQNGYSVVSAASGAEALARFEECEGAFDLLVTDVVMPGMSGPELAGELALRRPDLATLYISGYPDRTSGSSSATTLSPYLAKPFDAAKLLTTVRDVLGSSGRESVSG